MTMKMVISVGVGQHGAEHAVHGLVGHAVKVAYDKFIEVVQHPAGHRGVVHHQKAAADDAEPAVDVPLAVLGLQGLVAFHGALPAGPAYRQLHGQNGHAHDDEEQYVKEDEDAAAVCAGYIGKFPHVSDADGASGAHQQESQPGLKVFSFHESELLLISPKLQDEKRTACAVPARFVLSCFLW